MPGAARQAATRIARLRVAASGTDPLAARLRLERLLGGVEFQPPGLAPEAVLVVRHLRDPCPGVLSLTGRDLRAPPRWGAALSDRLSELARRAARPAAGAVPAGAEAVLFASREELLLCVAHDLLRCDAGRWWWEALFQGGDLAAALLEEIRAAPERLPTLLDALARGGEAGRFTRLLGAARTAELLRPLVERHGLGSLAQVLDANEEPLAAQRGPPPPLGDTGSATPDADAVGPLEAKVGRVDSPWRELAPEAAEAGAPEGELLLGIALLLARAPARVRSAAFAREVAAWLEAASSCPAIPSSASTSRSSAPVRSAASAVPARREPPSHSRAQRSGTAPSVRATLRGEGDSAPVVVSALPAGARTQRVQHQAGAARSRAHDERAGRAAPRDTAPVPAAGERAQPDADLPAPPPPRTVPDAVSYRPADSHDERTAGTTTGLGGIFFLLDLALELELYGDFTRPLAPGLALSPWDLLDLLGRRLLGEPVPEDPVWQLLAGLAGRAEGEPAGSGFEAPRRWRVPRAWLRPFTDSRRSRRSRSDAGARLEHPAGFAILEHPARPDLATPAQALERWIGWLTGYARARLTLALRLDDGAELAPLLLRRRARAVAGPTRLDLHFSQDEHPIAIRIAGLDRDPGWIPAAGRQVAFHFE